MAQPSLKGVEEIIDHICDDPTLTGYKAYQKFMKLIMNGVLEAASSQSKYRLVAGSILLHLLELSRENEKKSEEEGPEEGPEALIWTLSKIDSLIANLLKEKNLIYTSLRDITVPKQPEVKQENDFVPLIALKIADELDNSKNDSTPDKPNEADMAQSSMSSSTTESPAKRRRGKSRNSDSPSPATKRRPEEDLEECTRNIEMALRASEINPPSRSALCVSDSVNPLFDTKPAYLIPPTFIAPPQTSLNCTHYENVPLHEAPCKIKIVKKTFILGYPDGKVIIFKVGSGTWYSPFRHDAKVTSLMYKNSTLYTTSKDHTIYFYKMESRETIRKTLESPILSAAMYADTIYCGTKNGYLHKFRDTLSVATNPIQISNSAINSMTLAQLRGSLVIVISCHNQSVIVRAEDTGTILWSFDTVTCVESLQVYGKEQWFFGRKELFFISHCENDSFKTVFMDEHGVYTSAVFRDFLFVSSRNGMLKIFNPDAKLIHEVLLPYIPVHALDISKKKVVISCEDHRLISVDLPEIVSHAIKDF